MNERFFVSIDSSWLADEISKAEGPVDYVAPGILEKPAKALADLAYRIGPDLIRVYLDFSEHTIRMGFGDSVKTVETLRNADIKVSHTSGLRTGLVLIDNDGYVFTPTALYVEAEESTAKAPNAVRLSREQVQEARIHLSRLQKTIALTSAGTEEERKRIREVGEMKAETITDDKISKVRKRFQEAPLTRHDLSRQVRVYSAYMQYVEIELKGAALQRRTITIPKSIQGLGGGKNIDGRLKTTFNLIKKDNALSSKEFEDALRDIRDKLTPQLGKGNDRVVLKSKKQELERRLNDLEENLKKHKERVKNMLQEELDKSRKAVVDYYLPIVRKNPPQALLGRILGEPSDNERQKWLELELNKVFPKAESLIKGMDLKIRYKDVTYESLNDTDFIKSVEEAFPYENWEKLYDESITAGQKTRAYTG